MIRLARDYGNWYQLSTGKLFHANHGLISLVRQDSGAWELGHGYDGHLQTYYCGDADVDRHTLTPAERIEIADYMIALWTSYKQDIASGHTREAPLL